MAGSQNRTPTGLEALASVKAHLVELELMAPRDAMAFPLLNEVKRLVQQLRDGISRLQPDSPESNAWNA